MIIYFYFFQNKFLGFLIFLGLRGANFSPILPFSDEGQICGTLRRLKRKNKFIIFLSTSFKIFRLFQFLRFSCRFRHIFNKKRGEFQEREEEKESISIVISKNNQNTQQILSKFN